MALSAYSVSPTFLRKIFGPKPIENVSTPTPLFFATRKWPSSWMTMRMPSPTTAERTDWMTFNMQRSPILRDPAVEPRRTPLFTIPAAGVASDEPPRPLARPPVGLEDLPHVCGVERRVRLHRRGDHAVDVAAADALVQESGDRDLVGGVQHGRHRAARRERLEGERERGVALFLDRQKIELAQLGQLEARPSRLEPARIRERVSDRDPHIGNAELRDHRSVAVTDHRMDDALRMNNDVDPRRFEAEKPARLDDFEPFVHHGRRIDGDLRPHFPVRVFERLLDRDPVEAFERCSQERPARGGEDDLLDVFGPVALQALKDRAVLAVYWKKPHAALVRLADEDLAGHHKGFFVRERELFAGAEAGKRRHEARAADDRSEEHTSELQSHSFISYAVFCFKKKQYLQS